MAGGYSMTNQEAIDTIKANWPPENYSSLIEALNKAIDSLEDTKTAECTYYDANKKTPNCTHECNGCMWYV